MTSAGHDDRDAAGDVRAAADLEDLLQFFYQCPVGLIELDDAGVVRRINPASARMLTPLLLPGEGLHELYPVLRRISPDLLALITQDTTRLGPLRTGGRFLVATTASTQQFVEALAVRVELGRVMIVLIDVSEERRLTRREHDLAIELQRSMLGRVDPDSGASVCVTYRTAQVEQLVGGDWYDVITLPDRRVGLVVGDAVGHSITAVATMGQLRNAVRATAQWSRDPADLLLRMDVFAEGIEGAACSTLAYAVLDLDTGVLEYSSAGHLPPLFLPADRAPRFLTDGQGVPLACGVTPDHRVGRIRMEPGDVVLLYTDGLVERRTEAITDGLQRLHRSVQDLDDAVAGELTDRIAELLLAGVRLEDDVCLLAVTFLEPAPEEASSPARPGVVRQAFWVSDPLDPVIDVWGHGLHGEDLQNGDRWCPSGAGPADIPLGIRFRQVVEAHPSRVAVRDGQESLTYAGLAGRALGIAHRLRGGGRMDRPVALVCGHDVAGVVAVAGVLLSGRPLLILDPASPASRHRAAVLRTDASVVAADPEHAASARQVAAARSVPILTPGDGRDDDHCFDPALGHDSERPGRHDWAAAATIDPGATVLIATTSGSTGAPKLVISDHRQLLAEAWAAGSATGGVQQDDVVGLTLPVAFAGGFSAALTTLLTGAALSLYEARRHGSAGMDQWIADTGVTVLVTAPTALRTLVAGGPDPALLTGLRSAILLGEAVTGRDVLSARTALPPDCQVRHRYGSTETGLISELVLTARDTPPRGRLSAGQVVGPTRVEILDDEGTPLPAGSVGRIAIRRSTMALGYWDDPSADTAQFPVTSDGTRVFRSHDRGYLDPDGALHVLGRVDDCVKILGYLVDPAQVENALVELPDIGEAAVLAPGPHGRHRLIAFVVPASPVPDDEKATEQTICERLRAVLPEHMIPSRVVLLPALPRTTFGKVDRAALTAPADTADGATARDDAAWEDQVAQLWARALHRDQVPREADFITLGGDSLAAESLIAMIHELPDLADLADHEISSDLLGQAPTLALFAHRLRRRADVHRGAPPRS